MRYSVLAIGIFFLLGAVFFMIAKTSKDVPVSNPSSV
jgi:hypothetical protein